jgi:hypothetical protein
VIVDAETTPFVDVSAARMLVAAHEELRANGVRLMLARDVGQVRDVLGCFSDDGDLPPSYPTIEAATDAVGPARPAESVVIGPIQGARCASRRALRVGSFD